VPWRVESVVDARKAFINDWLQKRHELAFGRLCALHGITRQLGYKWVDRFHDGGMANLVDRSRAPIHRPHATPAEAVDAIVELRKRFTHFGPRKIRATLAEKYPNVHWPAPSTIGDILKARGLVTERARRRRTPASTQPLAAATAPNIVWSADFKGCFKVAGRWCHPLTITDNASRYLLCIQGGESESDELAWPTFERVFREYGLPWRIRTDNGSPFATRSIAGLSAMSVRWTRLGIIHERIEPGKPQQNGRHERMHRTLKAHVAQPPKPTAEDQQRAFDEFRAHFNNERPHEAIGQKTPSSVYAPSQRPMPDRLPEPDYPDDFQVRRVSLGGSIKWNGTRVSIGAVLSSEAIGVETIDDGISRLWFGHIYLGELREKGRGLNEFIANRR
jgi:putative transposase